MMDKTLSDAIKAVLGGYPAIRDKYYNATYSAVYDFLDSERSIATFKNGMKKAMVDAIGPAADTAWTDGGGKPPIDEATSAWVTAMQGGEVEYINVLFQNLKELRKSDGVDKAGTATARADGYTHTLDMIYNYVKVAAAGSTMLTFVGDDGAESCTDCKRYKGKRKKASWWIANNAVPPNRDFECKGYRCMHTLVDDWNQVWTL